MTNTPDRSVCHQTQQETTPVCVPSPRHGNPGSGRSEPIMEGHGWVCLSPTPLITNVITKILSHDCHRISHSGGLAQHVVLGSESMNPDTPLPALPTQSPHSTIQQDPT